MSWGPFGDHFDLHCIGDIQQDCELIGGSSHVPMYWRTSQNCVTHPRHLGSLDSLAVGM